MNRSRVTADLASHGNIFVDIANDRVGIGSTIPTDKVDIDGGFKLHDRSGFDNHITYGTNPPTITFPSGNPANLAKTPTLVFGDRTSGGDFKIYQDFYSLHMRHFGPSGLHIGSVASHIQISGSNGSNNTQASIRIDAGANEGVKLYSGGTQRFETVGYGVTVLGTTETQELNVTGVTTTSDDINLANNKKVKFGTMGFQIYQNTSPSNNAIIQQSAAGQFLRLITNGGALSIESDYVSLRNSTNSTQTAIFDADGKTSLYHNSNLKFTTESNGVNVTGNLVADCINSIDPDSYTNHFITGAIQDGSGWSAQGIAFGQGTGKMAAFGVSNSLYMAHGDGSNANSLTTFMEVSNAGRVKLHYNGSGKFETSSTGINVTGDITCTSDLILDSTNTDYPRITLHSNASGIRKYAIINGQGWNFLSVTPDVFAAVRGVGNIEFRLAKIDPYGNCTQGVTRTFSNLTNGARNNVKELIQWDPTRYMNVWVVKSIENFSEDGNIVLGFAQFPNQLSSDPETDGIVIRHNYCGSIESASSNYGHSFNGIYTKYYKTRQGRK